MVLSLMMAAGMAYAQGVTDEAGDRIPMPIYSAAEVMHSLYGKALPERAVAFTAAAKAQTQTVSQFCVGQGKVDVVRQQWQGTLTSWTQLSGVSLGPVVVRRSQRQIDFTPTRPQLIERAVNKNPQNAADMELVGTPAKGFGALDWLLAQGLKANTPECRFAVQVAQAIAAEAQGIEQDLQTLRSKVWDLGFEEEDELTPEQQAHIAQASKDTSVAMAEWVNQWLGGLERLRWTGMEKPVKAVDGSGKAAAFARQTQSDNVIEWQAMWQALREQALLKPGQKHLTPVAGQDVIAIEALLLSKGEMAMADKWAATFAQAEKAMQTLATAQSAKPVEFNAQVLAAATALKAITVMYQREVAPALDIPLGFSDADGD